jgi:hypothetical protein
MALVDHSCVGIMGDECSHAMAVHMAGVLQCSMLTCRTSELLVLCIAFVRAAIFCLFRQVNY